ncbi:MAG: murein hydrolase activator EnvC family protein [Actinomycetota bacterium]
MAGAVFVLLLFGAAAPPPVNAGTAEDLERARRQLERLEDDLKEARQRLNGVQTRLLSVTTQVSQVTSQVEGLRAAIAETKATIRRSTREVNRLQDTLNERARDAYMAGPAGAIELVLEAQSLTELSDRLSFLEVLSTDDAQVVEGISVRRQQVRELQARLLEYLAEYEEQLVLLEGRQEELDALFAEAAEAKAAYQDRVAEAEDAVDKLEKKLQRELLQQYGFTGSGVAAGPPLSADGPFYWCPVGEPRSYVDDFGAPRVGHTHQGNDIFAPVGTPIHAPFAGTAEEGFDGLGGIVVHVYASANADYVYNAHLVQHAGVDGQQVEPGDVIGYVGNTGNAAGTPSHDHFEYHPGGGSAISPYLYLNEVCGVGGIG